MAKQPNVTAKAEETGLVLDTTHDLHRDHLDPQIQVVRQNVRVALLPLAIIAFTLIALVAAAWTFLTALPAA
jgi:ABC-type nitrate/sulfonate/bicarbonate transport system permease component